MLKDFSNDDLDNEEEEEEPSSSLALSYKSAATTTYLEGNKVAPRNVTKTFLNIQQQQMQKQQSSLMKIRSRTPDTSFDGYDFLKFDRTNSSSERQRSLTPERRPITPELLFKESNRTTSQTSLMSRQSSGNSRNSTLERQLIRHEEGQLSRSSSSSSESRLKPSRPPFKSPFGDYKIRRSR